MKLDPDIHIVMHSVLSLKPGVTSAREGGVGEANSVAKLPEQRGANGGLDGDARTMATLLEQVLDGIFFFFPMEYILQLLLELLLYGKVHMNKLKESTADKPETPNAVAPLISTRYSGVHSTM